jgi:hypothetical protein
MEYRRGMHYLTSSYSVAPGAIDKTNDTWCFGSPVSQALRFTRMRDTRPDKRKGNYLKDLIASAAQVTTKLTIQLFLAKVLSNPHNCDLGMLPIWA